MCELHWDLPVRPPHTAHKIAEPLKSSQPTLLAMAADPKKQRASRDSLEAEKARLSEAFAVFDANGDGLISSEELGKALGGLGLHFTEEALSKMMNGRTHLGQCLRPTPSDCGVTVRRGECWGRPAVYVPLPPCGIRHLGSTASRASASHALRDSQDKTGRSRRCSALWGLVGDAPWHPTHPHQTAPSSRPSPSASAPSNSAAPACSPSSPRAER